ncbi:MAG: RDD family protein [Bacteriovoracaceae bacterium]|nr:RDD family protein [Bacteriovoracaceae bacterium]
MSDKILLKKAVRVARLSRIIAKLIDLFVVLILIIPFYPFGVLLALGYLSVCDSLQRGQSVGKKVIGFRVISLEDGAPCSVKQSVVRNLPLTIPLFFSIFPFWGWMISLLIGIPLALLELYFILSLDTGHRIGDIMADTTVMANDDSKEVINAKKAVGV